MSRRPAAENGRIKSSSEAAGRRRWSCVQQECPVYRGQLQATISRLKRKAWVIRHPQTNEVEAILIYKEENEVIESTPPLSAKNRLKICTFKATRRGEKVGELFLKIAINYAILNNINEIYVTLFPSVDETLIYLLVKYGFSKAGINTNKEDIYIKKIVPPHLNKYHQQRLANYPFYYDGNDVKKFVVPIRPRYHDKLFTEYKFRIKTLLDFSGRIIVEGNTGVAPISTGHLRNRRR